MEINATQAIGATWGAAATTTRPSTPLRSMPAADDANAAPMPMGVHPIAEPMLLAQLAAQAEAKPPAPAQPPIAPFDFHPLASAAGRYPLFDKMLEDVFGLDLADGAGGGQVDLAA